MTIDHISRFLFWFAAIWFFGGLAFFWWLFYARILRFIKKSLVTAKVVAKEVGWAAALLAPFSIPIAVTAICLYFG